jgi:sulfur-oxidizing protein SoxX
MKCCVVLFTVLLFSCARIQDVPEQRLVTGKKIAFERDKGNCLACHVIENGESPGNIGPALTALSSHFKNKQQLRDQIWDASRFNPETSMPPIGKNKIISEEEIDVLVDYLWSLK